MKFAERVAETSSTTGTGTLQLGGAKTGFQTFVAGVATGAVVYYAIVHQTSAEWEVGIGTVTDASPDTLSRTVVIASSNAAALVSFTAGTKDVLNVHPAIITDGTSLLKYPVRVATTAALTLASDCENGDTVDGIVLATGDRILVKNQATGAENGIYTVNASGAPTRAVDMPTGDAANGALTIVDLGTVNASTLFFCTAASGSDVVGTDALTWSQAGGASSTLAGLTDVTITAAISGDILRHNGSAWVDYADSNFAASSHTHAAVDISSGTLVHERGGLEVNASAFGGFIVIGGGATTELKSEFGKSAAPAVTDDSGSGYAVGSRWCDTTADKEYVCLDASVGVAVWVETTAAASSVTSTSNITDHAIVRGDGGAKGLQKSGLLIDDANVLEWPEQGTNPVGNPSANSWYLFFKSDGIYVEDDAGTVTGPFGIDVVAGANITDHALVRGDGGVKGVQDGGVVLDDSDVFEIPEQGGNPAGNPASGKWYFFTKSTGAFIEEDTGTVSGLLSAAAVITDNAIARGNGGNYGIQSSGVLLDDNDKLTVISSLQTITADSDGGTITFDMDASNVHAVTLGGNRTLAVTNDDTNQIFVLVLTQDGTGSRTVTWWANIKWDGGTVPTLTTVAAEKDCFGFIKSGASEYLGFVIGAAIA